MSADRRLLVGRVVGVYGIQGWVKLESFTDPRMRIFDYQPWELATSAGPIQARIAGGRPQGRGLVARLEGIDDRDAAAGLVGATVHVRRSALPDPGPGEVYWADLEGLDAVTEQGVRLGSVDHLFATGANDVLVVRDGKRERLIPFVRDEVVRDIDLERGTITLDWDPEF